MKAEEYLKRNHHTVKVKHDSCDKYTFEEDISLDVSIEAVYMARCEERSKALSSFEYVLKDAIMKQNNGFHVELSMLREQFKGLINK